MANVIKDLIRVQTFTTGTGTIATGNAMPGFLDFTNVPSGSVVTYGITDGLASEVGQGTYTYSGGNGTLTRTTIYASTNSGNPINLDGNAQVYLTISAEDIASLDNEGTWTPVDVSGGQLAISGVDCEYQVNGSWVQAHGVIQYPTNSDSHGVMIGGLPYPAEGFKMGFGYTALALPININGGSDTIMEGIYKTTTGTQLLNSELSGAFIAVYVTYKKSS